MRAVAGSQAAKMQLLCAMQMGIQEGQSSLMPRNTRSIHDLRCSQHFIRVQTTVSTHQSREIEQQPDGLKLQNAEPYVDDAAGS